MTSPSTDTRPTVGASLLAKNSKAPRVFRMHALSLTSIASKLAPTVSSVLAPSPCTPPDNQ
ncbi:hypothetical protein CEC48_27320 [Pseudomonas sp. K2I15]|nr:hypothetical protein CEC48_27320 [Pseudomonas sp. K2I15]